MQILNISSLRSLIQKFLLIFNLSQKARTSGFCRKIGITFTFCWSKCCTEFRVWETQFWKDFATGPKLSPRIVGGSWERLQKYVIITSRLEWKRLVRPSATCDNLLSRYIRCSPQVFHTHSYKFSCSDGFRRSEYPLRAELDARPRNWSLTTRLRWTCTS